MQKPSKTIASHCKSPKAAERARNLQQQSRGYRTGIRKMRQRFLPEVLRAGLAVSNTQQQLLYGKSTKVLCLVLRGNTLGLETHAFL